MGEIIREGHRGGEGLVIEVKNASEHQMTIPGFFPETKCGEGQTNAISSLYLNGRSYNKSVELVIVESARKRKR